MELAIETGRGLPTPVVNETIRPVGVNEASDGELIQRTGDGDADAFEVLYRRYARPMFGLALRRLGDRGRAEDAVQETFASVWRAAQSYKPERGPGGPWLYAVARNAIVDRGRARSEPAVETPEMESAEPGPPELAEAVYFSCVEALKRFGDGASVAIAVRNEGETIVFEIVDGNSGSTEPAAFAAMRDRVEALDGRLTIASESGTTRIAGSLPIR